MKLSLAPISLDRYFDTDKDMRTILELTRDCGFTYIDYDIKVKFQTVALSNLDNMIREECPENITSITVRF